MFRNIESNTPFMAKARITRRSPTFRGPFQVQEGLSLRPRYRLVFGEYENNVIKRQYCIIQLYIIWMLLCWAGLTRSTDHKGRIWLHAEHVIRKDAVPVDNGWAEPPIPRTSLWEPASKYLTWRWFHCNQPATLQITAFMSDDAHWQLPFKSGLIPS